MSKIELKVKEFQVDEATQGRLIELFNPFMLQAQEWTDKAMKLVVTDVSQTDLMKQAEEGRKFLKKVRTTVEKHRKELGNRALKEKQAIDGTAKMIRELIEPAEKHLEKQEKYIEIKREKELDHLETKRRLSILRYFPNPEFYNLREMDEQSFQVLLSELKQKHKQEKEREENERKEAEERVKRETEERIRKDQLLGLAAYIPDFETLDIMSLSDEKFRNMVATAEYNKKTQDEELDRLRAKEAAEKLRESNEKQLKSGDDIDKLKAMIRQLEQINYPDVDGKKAKVCIELIKECNRQSVNDLSVLINELLNC